MESEQCSWETSLSQRSGRPSDKFIYFSSGDGNWKSCGGIPCRITDCKWGSWGYCLSLFSLFYPTPIHFPSPTFLIITRELPSSLWEKGGKRRRKSGAAHSRCHLCLPHCQTLFIPHSCGLQSSAQHCTAATASSRKLIRLVHQAPPGLSVSTWEA